MAYDPLKVHVSHADGEDSPFNVVRMKSAITALFNPHVDFATQERIVKGFSR